MLGQGISSLQYVATTVDQETNQKRALTQNHEANDLHQLDVLDFFFLALKHDQMVRNGLNVYFDGRNDWERERAPFGSVLLF